MNKNLPISPATQILTDGPGSQGGSPTAIKIIAVLMTVAALYLGKDIFVPFALATLLGFILDPMVSRLRRWHVPRAPAVFLVMVATVAVLGATSLFVGGQMVQLAKDLPTYQATVQGKLRDLRQLHTGHGLFDDATRMVDVVGGELEAATRDLAPPSLTRATNAAPLRVSVEPAPRTAMQTLHDWVEPAMAPVATGGIVLVFLVFILLGRNDMRDRLLRLVGGDLHRTTDALGEAADRVSRYLTMQLVVNLSYGVPLGLGLSLLGVPGAMLWGVLGAMLRFVPYVGPLIASSFPLALAFAVDPGWNMLLGTLALVLTLELLINNLVEPWLYGASTGLSPVSIIVSAVVWTAMWGPVGLILATPLTVCLAVLGRHLPALHWLDTLLGSHPAFDRPTRLYQRLLAGDVAEAIELADEQAQKEGLMSFYSDTAIPALQLAAADHTRASSSEHRHRVAHGMAAVIRELRDDHPSHPTAPRGKASGGVLCIGARWEVDTLAAEMLAHALNAEGMRSAVRPASTVAADHIQSLDLTGVRTACLSSFSTTPEAQIRYIARRLKRRMPELRILVALWNGPSALLSPEAPALLGVDAVARTASEAMAHLRALRSEEVQAPVPTAQATPLQDSDRVKALHASGALEPSISPALDRAAQRAADAFDTPLAMVSLINETCQVWQGVAGWDDSAPDASRISPREQSLCGQVVARDDTLVIEDIARDPRFAGNPALQAARIRFYAGAPLRTASGHVIGALALLDHEPRILSASERRLLEMMAADVMAFIASQSATKRSVSSTLPALSELAGRFIGLPPGAPHQAAVA